MTTLTDRTRILNNKRCPRERFLAFHARNTGITSSRLVVSLSTGLAIHNGVEQILKGLDIEEAVKIAIDDYSIEVSKKELELEDNEDQLFVFEEQKALIEALIRVYYLVQYPKILSEYEVLGVEKEINWVLVEDKINPCMVCKETGKVTEINSNNNGENIKVELSCYNCYGKGYYSDTNNGTIICMSRLDAELKDKSTNSIVIYSLKSSSSWTDTNEKQNKYDDQGISELIAYEREHNCEVEAIKMDFLIKGSRSWLKRQDGEGYEKLQNSFLVHPYLLETPFNVQYSLKYTKSKGYRRVNIWQEMEIKEWIQMLFENDYEALAGGFGENEKNKGVIITPYNYVRDFEDIKSWLEQTKYQEYMINSHINILKNMEPNLPGYRETQNQGYKTLLNEYFPQNRSSCYSYGRYCSFTNICWEGLQTTSYEYGPRTPHHELELVQLTKG